MYACLSEMNECIPDRYTFAVIKSQLFTRQADKMVLKKGRVRMRWVLVVVVVVVVQQAPGRRWGQEQEE